jgi:diguanylate cyclase (GGDEF)-like protein
LLNRRAIEESLLAQVQRSRRTGEPFAMLMLDLDHFKSINDRYRHLVGDTALRWVAVNIKSQCRQTDLCARLGGDEFALVIAAPTAVALQVCTRLRVAVAQHCPDLPADLAIRLSAGVAEATAPCDVQHLFKRADEALYAAKAAGRDTVHHDSPKDFPA